MTKEEGIAELWRRGVLHWKLHETQAKIYASIMESDRQKFVLECSRRLGKTFTLVLIAIEWGIKNPNSQIRFANPTQKALKKIILPIIRTILADCPKALRPQWKAQEQVFIFPNGSEFHLAGTDAGNVESLRGTAADLCIVDEAQSMDDLDYVVDDVLAPQLISTRGKMLIAGTPPRSPDHAFVKRCELAEHEGYHAHYTIHDSHYDKDVIAEYCEEAGGENSTTWKREYLAMRVADAELQIFPEFSDSFVKEPQRDEFFRYYHKYLGLDLGVKHDLTAGLYAYYDFRRAILCIEDEFDMSGPDMTTERLLDAIRTKEKELSYEKMYRRIADNNNPLLIQDLTGLHRTHMIPVEKIDLHGMVNRTRMLLKSGRIEIHPRCQRVIRTLKAAIWDKHRKEFGRSLTLGHFDYGAALVYLVMMLDQVSNPVPVLHGINAYDTQIRHDLLEQAKTTKNFREFSKLFPVKLKVKDNIHAG